MIRYYRELAARYIFIYEILITQIISRMLFFRPVSIFVVLYLKLSACIQLPWVHRFLFESKLRINPNGDAPHTTWLSKLASK